MGICPHTIPDYITSNEVFSQEIMMIVGDNFADFNMDNYPPMQETTLAKACHIFQDNKMDSYEKVGAFFKLLMKKKETSLISCHRYRRDPMPPFPRLTGRALDLARLVKLGNSNFAPNSFADLDFPRKACSPHASGALNGLPTIVNDGLESRHNPII